MKYKILKIRRAWNWPVCREHRGVFLPELTISFQVTFELVYVPARYSENCKELYLVLTERGGVQHRSSTTQALQCQKGVNCCCQVDVTFSLSFNKITYWYLLRPYIYIYITVNNTWSPKFQLWRVQDSGIPIFLMDRVSDSISNLSLTFHHKNF